MKQFAIIGLSSFGKMMLEELSETACEILIIDKNRERVEKYKQVATNAFIADVINEEIIRKLVPSTIDAAIIDLGGKIEVSILVANYLSKMGVRRIIAKADSDEHAEILDIVGATQVVLPNREAAKRITPLLVSSLLFNYMPISNGLVMAEVKVPEKYFGTTLIEADLRRTAQLNVIAIRKEEESDYEFFSPDYRLQDDDIFLIVGNEKNVASFSGTDAPVRKSNIGGFFKTLLGRKK